MDNREQEDNYSALSEWIESQRKTYGSRKDVGERISRMVADLSVESKLISGVIADRLAD